jgi:hypothetical protein
MNETNGGAAAQIAQNGFCSALPSSIYHLQQNQINPWRFAVPGTIIDAMPYEPPDAEKALVHASLESIRTEKPKSRHYGW